MKQQKLFSNFDEIHLPRRQFVKGVAMGGVFLGLGLSPRHLFAADGSFTSQQVLRGKDFNLQIAPQAVNYTGHKRFATAVNGSVPGPILRWREGDQVTLNVTNHLAESSSIHWHGMILPAGMDGVPDISFKGIEPGESFRYQFDVRQSGTFWYHSHSGFQEQTGLYGAIKLEFCSSTRQARVLLNLFLVNRNLLCYQMQPHLKNGQLAQMDRALASGAKGHRFESCITRQIRLKGYKA